MRKLAFRLLAALLFAAPAVWAQSDYPNHAVRIVVPFPAGGPTDIVARPLAQKLSEALGQQFIVDNRGGSGGVSHRPARRR